MSDQLSLIDDAEPSPVEEQPLDGRPPLGPIALPPVDIGRSLSAVRRELADQLEEGSRCPCCDQHAQVYRWSLYATAARALIHLYRIGRTDTFVESKEVKLPGQGSRMSELRHWELVEQESERRPDGGKSGFWCVTPLGEEFVLGRATIPRYVYVYSGRVLWVGGEPRTIRDALGRRFNYDEMMAGLF